MGRTYVLALFAVSVSAHALPRASGKCDYLLSAVGSPEKLFVMRNAPVTLSTNEATLPDAMKRINENYDKAVVGTFTGFRGVPIVYRKWEVPNEKGAVVIFTGFASHSYGWREAIDNFLAQGYSVYIMDPRGHGESGRMTDNPKQVHVDDFDHYVKDTKKFMETVVKATPHLKTFGVFNSMGGGYGIPHLKQYPGDFDKVAMIAPMVGVRPGGLPPILAQTLGAVAKMFGYGKAYAIGQHNHARDVTSFENQHSTSSRTRWQLLDKEPFQDRPELHMGGATYGWVERAVQQARENQAVAKHIKTPMLVIQAGNEDTVDNKAMNKFVRDAPDARLLHIPGAGHWLLGESEDKRGPMMHAIFDFFSP